MPTETHADRVRRPKRPRAMRPGAMLDQNITRILGAATMPLSAYDIAARLRENGHPIVMMSVYRSLGRLCSRRSVEKIETTARFRIKDAPRTVLMVCIACGATTALPVPGHHEAIEHAVVAAGFPVQRMVLEAVGLCAACRQSSLPAG